MFNKKLWLILGGTGQLGRSMQYQLVKNKIEFVAPNSKNLDLRDYQKTRDFILNHNPSVVVNCAGWTNVQKAENNFQEANNLNGYSVENLARVCGQISTTFAHVSTDYVFSGIKKTAYLVSEKVDPVNAYGVSKALGEKLVRESGLEKFYIFRTAWLYSEFGYNFVKTIITKYQSGLSEINVVNDQLGNPTYASDLAFQIVKSINYKIPYGIYHAVNSGVASWYDLAVKVIDYLGYDFKIIKGISSREYSSDVFRPQNTSLDLSSWSQVGIPEMRPWQEALKSAIPKISQNV